MTWTLVPGSSVSLSGLTGSLLAGLAVTAHNLSGSSTVTFAAVNGAGGVTASPTATGTVAATATPTNTLTSVPTLTNTLTPSPAPTNTLTPVPTPTNTFTLVPTPTNTLTPVPAPTNTLVPTATSTPPATVGCPAGWTCTDIGGPTVPGHESVAGNVWTVVGGGGDIWGTGDQLRFDYQTLSGDGSVSAQVLTQSESDPWAKAGVMLRGNTGPGAAFYDVVVTPANGISVQYRSPQGVMAVVQASLSGTVPVYLRATRNGTTFSAYTSADGVTWTLVPGSSVSLSGLTGSLLAGLAVTAHNLSGSSTVTFTAVAA